MATVALHPEIEAVRHLASPTPDIDATILPTLRGALFEPPQLSDVVERTDHVVSENPRVVVRVHRPINLSGPVPCLYAIHGGGYIMGTYQMDDAKLDRWCQDFGMIGVSVEYRLAPETPFPGPLDDCHAGLVWTFSHAADLGIDPAKIGITGESAGGGLCAALALLNRDRGEVPVQFQLLDCPMLDDRQETASSQLDDLFIWTKASNTFGWRSYLGDLYGSNDVPYYASAARADDLSGLPEAYVCVGGADGFRNEDVAYAVALNDAGVPTELHLYPGVPHGVSLFADTQIAQRYMGDQTDWLRRQLERLSGQ